MPSIVTNSNNANTDNYVWRNLELHTENNTEIDFNNQLLTALNQDSSEKYSNDDDKVIIPLTDNSVQLPNFINPLTSALTNNISHINNHKKVTISHKSSNNKNIHNQIKNVNKNIKSNEVHLKGKNIKENNKFAGIKPESEKNNEINAKFKGKNTEINRKISSNSLKSQLINQSIRFSNQLNNNGNKNIEQFHLIEDKLDLKSYNNLNIKSLRIKTIKIDKTKNHKVEHKGNKLISKPNHNNAQNIAHSNKTNKNNTQTISKSQIDYSNNNTKPIIVTGNIVEIKPKKIIKEKSKNIVKKESKTGNIYKKEKSEEFDNISRLNNNKTKSKNNILKNQEVTKADKKTSTINHKNNFQNLIHSLKTVDSNHNNIANNANGVNTTGYDSQYEVKLENLSKTITNISKNVSNNTYHTARLVMQPESLGTIIVKIIVQNNVAKLNIDVGSEKAIKNIENQIGLLKSNLAQEGIKTDKIEITQQKNDGLNNKNERKKNDNYKQNYQVIEDFVNSFKNLTD